MLFSNSCIIIRKLVSIEAEGTDPHLASIINLTVRIDDSPTVLSLTCHWFVKNRRKGSSHGFLERSEETSQGKYNLCCFNSGRWPNIPVESDSVDILCCFNKVLKSSHCLPQKHWIHRQKSATVLKKKSRIPIKRLMMMSIQRRINSTSACVRRQWRLLLASKSGWIILGDQYCWVYPDEYSNRQSNLRLERLGFGRLHEVDSSAEIKLRLD